MLIMTDVRQFIFRVLVQGGNLVKRQCLKLCELPDRPNSEDDFYADC